MINEKAYALGANRSCIRDLFEYGRQRAAIVGDENVFDENVFILKLSRSRVVAEQPNPRKVSRVMLE